MMSGANDDFTASVYSASAERNQFRELRRRNILRLSLTYLAPLIILTILFYFQYRSIMIEGRDLHLRAIAEHQANMLDLFFSERFVNLANLIDDPRLTFPPESETLQLALEKLKKNSGTFIDLGYFDSTGIQVSYAGPYKSLEKRDYGSEPWYQVLKDGKQDHLITDVYPGFRQELHFTIAISRVINGSFVVLRATLDPGKIYEYVRSMEGSPEIYTSIVNKAGRFQLVKSLAQAVSATSVTPPDSARFGLAKARVGSRQFSYAYSWLKTADWALIVRSINDREKYFMSGLGPRIVGMSAAMVLLGFLVIIYRAKKLVQFQLESNRTRAQLEHAAKLASVGELASGIAHEINNPLAVINEEAGLIKDLMLIRPGKRAECEELVPHLNTIQETVFRCRDITHKLLTFVRKSDIDLREHDIKALIDGVVDGLLGPEIDVSRVKIIRDYDLMLPKLLIDANQFQQVVLNIVNNAIDAIGGTVGKITIKTRLESSDVVISINDTGQGMAPETIEKIFLPFFTTKEVGKGTGLGLSVSYGIIKNLGGKIEVESTFGQGTTFKIMFPQK